MVTLGTNEFNNKKKLHSAHRACLWVLCNSQNSEYFCVRHELIDFYSRNCAVRTGPLYTVQVRWSYWAYSRGFEGFIVSWPHKSLTERLDSKLAGVVKPLVRHLGRDLHWPRVYPGLPKGRKGDRERQTCRGCLSIGGHVDQLINRVQEAVFDYPDWYVSLIFSQF